MVSKGRSASIAHPTSFDLETFSSRQRSTLKDEIFKESSKSRSKAHRSQSARVSGSQRPKFKKRETALVSDSNFLDLAGSEGAISGNYNNSQFPSKNGLKNSQSSEMGKLGHGAKKEIKSSSQEFSPRRNSTPERDGARRNNVPTIQTPEGTPQAVRRGSAINNKPNGLPRSPTIGRSGSNRRANSVKVKKSATSYLDVPDIRTNDGDDDDDEESYRLRSFSVTPKGIVNRGDSFRRRRSRSNSLIPGPSSSSDLTANGNSPNFIASHDGFLLPSNLPTHYHSSGSVNKKLSDSASYEFKSKNDESKCEGGGDEDGKLVNHRVGMIGSRGVGKAALVSQFMTSEHINAYDRQNDVEGEETVSVMLNGEESEMTFFKITNPKSDVSRVESPDGFVVVYSVVDRSSFNKAENELRRLQELDLIRTKAVVLVGNKIDLVRSRAVSTQDGRCLAVSFRVKFIEVSVGINHNVDELLVGLLHQIRLKQAQAGTQENWCKNRGILRASVKARQMLTWLLGKEDAKFKNCENLHIL